MRRSGTALMMCPWTKIWAFAVAGGDAEVGFAGFAGAVDGAAHDRDTQGVGEAREGGLDLRDQVVDVDLRPPTRRTGHDVQATLPQPEGFQNAQARGDFFDGWGGEGHPEGVADALGE
jgi:hypothetical protein